jgi:hypothetical protein
MPDEYVPELGQFCFGQPHQPYAADPYLEAALFMIENELDRVMGNIHQEKYPSPFRNTGNRFDCPTFSAHAYSWNEDEEQPWNFRWRDVEISWYKRLGRGLSINRAIEPNEAAVMLRECLAALREIEERDEKEQSL